jgi:predicted NAD/FAD-binding protein
MKIAIIGTGISGLGAAYLLHKQHEITVYESDTRVGGHSRTIFVNDGSEQIPVDTGFIVFNKKNYPLLTRLFEILDVPIIESDMSFGVSVKDGWLEYGSKSMFSQKANWLRPQFWRMIMDILKFNKHALAYVGDRQDITLRQCLSDMKMGDWFCRYYLQAMGAAIWSCSVETILDFPAYTFLRFFENHGLLSVDDHPQWYTVKGGSREYIQRLTKNFSDKIKISCAVTKISRNQDSVTVRDSFGDEEHYDHVILACHADQALNMIEQPSKTEKDILSAFQYQKNSIIVHTDPSFMPKLKKCWASWVYLSQRTADNLPLVSLSYWMNQLQNLKTRSPILVTLNPHRRPKSDLVQDEYDFTHPVFTLHTLRAQKRIHEIQGINRISYCGAYLRYGFHEDGFMSAVEVAKQLGVVF